MTIDEQCAGIGKTMQNERKVCWPTQWIEAAQRAGFVTYKGDGRYVFESDKMRDSLGQFAEEIITSDRETEAK